jgi:hypothetical protein
LRAFFVAGVSTRMVASRPAIAMSISRHVSLAGLLAGPAPKASVDGGVSFGVPVAPSTPPDGVASVGWFRNAQIVIVPAGPRT